jgi:hypothetical protein
MEYRRQGQSTWTNFTPQSGKTLGSYLSGGIVADTGLDGAYEVDFPDAAFASAAGVEWVQLRVRGVTNMLATISVIELDAVDYQDAAAFGLSRIDATIGSRSTYAGGPVDSVTGAVGSVASYGTLVSDITTSVWSAGTRTLTGFGTLVSDVATAVWSAATRTLTAFGFNVNLTPNTGLGDQNGSVATVNTVLELGQNALSANGASNEVAEAVWDAPYNQHTTAGSFGKLMDILRKANTVVEGTVTSAVTPTATSFSSNVNYPTGAFKHAVLVFVNSAAIDEQNSPILGYVNTNGVFTVEEAFTVAPTVGDEFIIVPTNHVHSIAAIVAAVLGQATSTSAYDAGDVGYVLRQLFGMIESDGAGGWQYTADALDQAPAGGGGGGTDWTANERTAIRAILGVPTSGTTPTDPTTGILDTIRDSIGGSSTINVYPVSASTPERVAGTTITYYRNEIRTVSVVTGFALTSLTLVFVIEDAEGTDLLSIPNSSISRSDKTFTVSIGTAVTATVSNYRWSLRDITGGTNSVIARGVLTVQEAG